MIADNFARATLGELYRNQIVASTNGRSQAVSSRSSVSLSGVQITDRQHQASGTYSLACGEILLTRCTAAEPEMRAAAERLYRTAAKQLKLKRDLPPCPERPDSPPPPAADPVERPDRADRPPPAAPRRAAPPAALSDDHFANANTLMRHRDVEGAIAELRKAVKKNPRHAMAWRLMGMAYWSIDERAKAKRAFERFLELKPDHPDAPKLRKLIAD